MTRSRIIALILPLIVSAVVVSACGDDDDDAASDATSPYANVTAIERQLLEQASPNGASGQDLQLTRVVIPAGQTITTHTHPGPQLAVIVEGTLTYSVIKGEVTVTRAAGTPGARKEVFRAGQVAELKPGDSLLETTDLVHSGGNRGSTPVVIYLSSLFPSGAPASSPAQ